MSDRNDRTLCPRCVANDITPHMHPDDECRPVFAQPPPLAVGQEVWVRAKIQQIGRVVAEISIENAIAVSNRFIVRISALRRGEE